MLVCLRRGERVVASKQLSRSDEYFCPACSEPVFLRFGDSVCAHFSHYTDSRCSYGSGESYAHMKLKLDLYTAYKACGIPVDVEVDFKQRRADVVILTPQRNMVVLELQRSAISREEISARAAFYSSVGAAQAWIPLLEGRFVWWSQDFHVIIPPDTKALRPFVRWISDFHYRSLFWAYSTHYQCFLPVRIQRIGESLSHAYGFWKAPEDEPPRYNYTIAEFCSLPLGFIQRSISPDFPSAWLLDPVKQLDSACVLSRLSS